MIDEFVIDALSPSEQRQVFGWLMRRLQRPHRRGKWICRLSAMSPGDSLLTTELRDGSNLATAKRGARLRLDAPDAQWTTRTTTKGIRITRVR